jgi:DNA-directed RNA polymerase subunit K/omega
VVGRGRWRRLALGSCGWRARQLEEDGGDRVVDDDNDDNTPMAARDYR